MVSKLSRELKNAPTDASLVCSSASERLSKVERLSASHKVLADNLGEENQLLTHGKGGQNLRVSVYVVSMRGNPLMPTTPKRARKLLKERKTKVISRAPFTIQLNYPTGETTQLIALGIDAGYTKIGFSAISEKNELFAGEVTLRKDVSKRLTERRMYRRTRRERLWYRKPRFLNRTGSKKKDWLAPSITHKLDTHVRLVKQIKRLLPVTNTIVEVASFDIQKIEKPEISGLEYQQGTLFGYTVRNYLLEKWGHQCAYCKKPSIPLEVEHIIPKSRGGSDRIDNLAVSCHKCNEKKSNKLSSECSPKLRHQILTIIKRAVKSYKSATFMNVVRWKLVERLNCQYTYGDRTKYHRMKIGLSKSHINDAFVVAGGLNQTRTQSFVVKQIRRNNRCLQKNRKGFKPSIRTRRYPYQPNDLVHYNKRLYRVKGTHNKGTRVILATPAENQKNKSFSVKKLTLVTYGKGLSFNLNSYP